MSTSPGKNKGSFKIKVRYVVVPTGTTFTEKEVDTPYRFETRDEAEEYVRKYFPHYNVRIQDSRDPSNVRDEEYFRKQIQLYEPYPGNLPEANRSKSLEERLEDIRIVRMQLENKEFETIQKAKKTFAKIIPSGATPAKEQKTESEKKGFFGSMFSSETKPTAEESKPTTSKVTSEITQEQKPQAEKKGLFGSLFGSEKATTAPSTKETLPIS
jgi:hypothetical protein